MTSFFFQKMKGLLKTGFARRYFPVIGSPHHQGVWGIFGEAITFLVKSGVRCAHVVLWVGYRRQGANRGKRKALDAGGRSGLSWNDE